MKNVDRHLMVRRALTSSCLHQERGHSHLTRCCLLVSIAHSMGELGAGALPSTAVGNDQCGILNPGPLGI